MRARTLYRLLCVRYLLGSAVWNVPGRIAMWSAGSLRNSRSGREVARLIQQFHCDASGLLSQGVTPTALLNQLIGPVGTNVEAEADRDGEA